MSDLNQSGTLLSDAYISPQIPITNDLILENKEITNVEYSPNVEYVPVKEDPPVKVVNQNEQNDNLKLKLDALQKNIDRQNIQYRESYEKTSIFDNILSKKKFITKFLNLSLIILFALSLNSTILSFMKDYFSASNFPRNKQMYLKGLYPVFVFVIAVLMKL